MNNNEEYKKQITDALSEGIKSGNIPSPHIIFGDYVEKKIIVESGGIAEQNNYYGTDKPSNAEQDSAQEEQPNTKPETPNQEPQLPDSVVYLENKPEGRTLDVCKAKVYAIFCDSGSKKEVLEELFNYHNRYINLYKLGQEERIEWLNSIPSKFQGTFNKSDLKYYHELEDDPKRRTRS